MTPLRQWFRGLGRLCGLACSESGEECWGDGLDQLPLALVRLDGEGRMSRLSAGWETLTGYRTRQCLQRPHEEYLHPEDRPRWQQCLQDLRGVAEVQPCVEIFRYLGRGGALRWVEVRLRRHGEGFVASLGDISEQMQYRQTLQASHRSLSNLLDALPAMVYRCRNNRLWNMEYVSAGCLELTGYRAEDLIDSQRLSFHSLIHPEDCEHVWCEVQAGLDERRPFAFDYRLLCADGSLKPVLERGCGIFSESGEVLGLEGVITERAVGRA